MTQIAFLGTGLLGSGLAEAAAKRGDSVTAWNRTIDKARALEPFGVHVANNPADAVRSTERVHLVLKDDRVVDEVIETLRPGLDATAVIVDHTTTQPKLTAERAKRLNAEGVRYIHCPVFIGPAAARQSQGTILSSGPRALFDAIQPALAKMAERVEYFGERPDFAAVIKLSGNAVIIGLSGVVADVLSIGDGAGLAPDETMKVFGLLNVQAMLAGRGRNMAAGNFAPSFELTMARKDVRLMLETAEDHPTPVLSSIADRMDELIDAGHGEEDLAVIGLDSVKKR
ncbi:MAG TPA: NAD(P)-binding domain-containing protein [Gemmatimonadaceae bacterium]|jgi:3-hydroxyisobutyrate dehydrogenase-like beta-hydroxyacid dehydrogenase